MRLLSYVLLISAASMGMSIYADVQDFGGTNYTNIPVYVTAKFQERVAQTKRVDPGTSFNIQIIDILQSQEKQLQYFKLKTSSGETKVDVNSYTPGRLVLTGPQKDSQPPVYQWKLSSGPGGTFK